MLYVFPIYLELITYHRCHRLNMFFVVFDYEDAYIRYVFRPFISVLLFPIGAYNLIYANYLGSIVIIWVLFFGPYGFRICRRLFGFYSIRCFGYSKAYMGLHSHYNTIKSLLSLALLSLLRTFGKKALSFHQSFPLALPLPCIFFVRLP